jgi:hypothetical protein
VRSLLSARAQVLDGRALTPASDMWAWAALVLALSSEDSERSQLPLLFPAGPPTGAGAAPRALRLPLAHTLADAAAEERAAAQRLRHFCANARRNVRPRRCVPRMLQ